jgi:predicted small lipoprotein YifL
MTTEARRCLAALLLAALSTGACGLKGDLYLPEAPVATPDGTPAAEGSRDEDDEASAAPDG